MMRPIENLMIAAAAAALAAGCATTEGGAATAAGSTIGEQATPNDSIAEARAGRGGAVLAAADSEWPPAGCPDAATLRAFVNDPAHSGNLAYFGFYSDGNAIWLGSNHGSNVFDPHTPYPIPRNARPFVMRWNISDTPRGGQPISNDYALDYDAARDGPYAVRAFAINQCYTDNLGNYGSCDQPVFGAAAWRDDADYCPPIILSEDPTSVYLWTSNEPKSLPQVYDYSLAIVLKAKRPNDPKAGLRLIIDPRIKNGSDNR